MLSASSSPGSLNSASSAASAAGGLLPFAGTPPASTATEPGSSFASLLDGEAALDGSNDDAATLTPNGEEASDQPTVLSTSASGRAVFMNLGADSAAPANETDFETPAGEEDPAEAATDTAEEEPAGTETDRMTPEPAAVAVHPDEITCPAVDAGAAETDALEESDGGRGMVEQASRRQPRQGSANTTSTQRPERRDTMANQPEEPVVTGSEHRGHLPLENRGLARAAEVAQGAEHSAVARYREQQAAAESELADSEWAPRGPEARESRDSWRRAASSGWDRIAFAGTGRTEPATPEPVQLTSDAEFELGSLEIAPVLPPARIAGSAAARSDEAAAEPRAQLEKLTQAIAEQVVNPSLRTLGIDPAKVSATMEFVSPERTPLGAEAPLGQPGSSFATGAARTVEQVLQAADLMRATERSGVQLRLDFGESGPLSVQITLRQGRVHTLFRSDSPELRSTLAQAWDSFAQRGDVAVLPLAEPVLLPLRSSASSTLADGGRFGGSFAQADSEGRSGRESRATREETSRNAAPLSRRRSSRSVTSTPVRESAPGHLRVHV